MGLESGTKQPLDGIKNAWILRPYPELEAVHQDARDSVKELTHISIRGDTRMTLCEMRFRLVEGCCDIEDKIKMKDRL